MTTQQQYEILRQELNEQQWCLYLGTKALKIGTMTSVRSPHGQVRIGKQCSARSKNCKESGLGRKARYANWYKKMTEAR